MRRLNAIRSAALPALTSRSILLSLATLLAGCASSGPELRPPACTHSAPGRGSYSISQVGERSGDTATVVALLSDVDSRIPFGPYSANLVARDPAAPDSILTGAAPDSLGHLAFNVPPGVIALDASAVGYARIQTDPISLSPGSVWLVNLQLHRSCPIVEMF